MKATIKIGIIEIRFEGTVAELFELIERLLTKFPHTILVAMILMLRRQLHGSPTPKKGQN